MGSGYYIKAISDKSGNITLTHYQMDIGKVVKISPDGKTIFKKDTLLHSLILSNNGFIGVKDGTIKAFDNYGEKIWEKIVDSKKVIRKAGGRVDQKSGKTITFKRVFNRLNLKYLLHLKNGNYLAVGRYDSDFAFVIFDESGTIKSYKHYNLGRLYIDNVIATSDGGFAIVARRGLQFFKFDENGKVIFKKDLREVNSRSRYIYSYALVELKDGYLISSSVGGSATIQITKIDKNGNKISTQKYAKKGQRLHPQFIVKSPSGEYLLAINVELHEPWIVNLSSNGEIKADLLNPTKYKNTSLPKSRILEQKKIGNILPNHTPLKPKASKVLKSIEVKTERFLGGRIRKMVLSKDKKRLYAITGATGFKIFEKRAKKWQEIGNIRRTFSKLIITPNRISPVDGKPPKRETPYDYDFPADFYINQNETIAYISDIKHGFYAVDISNGADPKIIFSVPKLKISSFVLSNDGKRIFFYAQGNLHSLLLEELRKNSKKIDIKNSFHNKIVAIDGGKKLAVADRAFLILYKSDTMELVGELNIAGGSSIRRLKSSGNFLSVLVGYKEARVFQISDKNQFKYITTIYSKDFVSDMILLPKKDLFCTATKKGVICFSYRDKLNPKPIIHYRNIALSGATAITQDEDKIIINFISENLGVGEI